MFRRYVCVYDCRVLQGGSGSGIQKVVSMNTCGECRRTRKRSRTTRMPVARSRWLLPAGRERMCLQTGWLGVWMKDCVRQLFTAAALTSPCHRRGRVQLHRSTCTLVSKESCDSKDTHTIRMKDMRTFRMTRLTTALLGIMVHQDAEDSSFSWGCNRNVRLRHAMSGKSRQRERERERARVCVCVCACAQALSKAKRREREREKERKRERERAREGGREGGGERGGEGGRERGRTPQPACARGGGDCHFPWLCGRRRESHFGSSL